MDNRETVIRKAFEETGTGLVVAPEQLAIAVNRLSGDQFAEFLRLIRNVDPRELALFMACSTKHVYREVEADETFPAARTSGGYLKFSLGEVWHHMKERGKLWPQKTKGVTGSGSKAAVAKSGSAEPSPSAPPNQKSTRSNRRFDRAALIGRE